MSLENKFKTLIENSIKNNRRYSKYVDFFDYFYEESFVRLKDILNTIDDERTADIYINKVVNTVILETIKNGKKKEITSQPAEEDSKNEVEQIINPYPLDEKDEISFDIPDPLTEIESEEISEGDLQKLKNIISSFKEKENCRDYYDIFMMYYLQNMPKSEIAFSVGLTEEQVDKKIVELSKKIINKLN